MKAALELRGCDEPNRLEYKYDVDANQISFVCQPAEYPKAVHGNGMYRAIRECNAEGWEEIVSATIENNARASNIMEYLPSGYHAFRNVKKSSRAGGVEFSAREKAIRLDCSLETPESLLYLAQGVGQAIADDSDSALLAVTKSAWHLLITKNVEVHCSILAAEQAGWEFVWEQIEPFSSDDPAAVFNKSRILEGIYQILEQRSSAMHAERARPYKETLKRIGRSAVLLVANMVADTQEKPPTYEEFMSRR